MPKLKIDHIVSFSSEDPMHLANNILSSDTSKKWKCRTVGEKTAVVVLQLEKASIITGIDIGNEHSAYIEVLVSRLGTNDDYKVLLVTSAFMTPLESRQSQNINKVRMFTKEHLSKPECEEKWDRLKVICTQPFNKHIQYGLSFINLHTSDDKNGGALIQTNIGKFTLRPESPSNNLSAGSLFAKQKELKGEKLTGAAAIREASSPLSLALYGSPVCKPKLKNQSLIPSAKKGNVEDAEKSPKPRNRNELLYSKDEEEPNEKIDKLIEKKIKETKEKEKIKEMPKKKLFDTNIKDNSTTIKKKDKENGKHTPKLLNISTKSPSVLKTKGKKGKNNYKRRNKEEAEEENQIKKLKQNVVTKPFAKLLEGVTLVISGIQNPDRANLRSLALSMGAKYKSDWDNTCTHLICAFPNTPKFNQVQGKGKIVKRKWLEDCHSQRKRLPWRRYGLDKNDIGRDESEDEICEEIENDCSVSANLSSESEMDERDKQEEGGLDTDEEIARIEAIHNKNQESDVRRTNESVYTADTDEEDYTKDITSPLLNKLRNLFQNKKFYVDQSYDEEVYNKLQKYIIAYDGKLFDSPTDNVDIIITSKENSNSFKEINTEATCVGPGWIWECHNNQNLVPLDDFVY